MRFRELSLYHHAIMIHQTARLEAGAGLPTASRDDDRHVSLIGLRQSPTADYTHKDLDDTELQMRVSRPGNTHAFWRLSQSDPKGLQSPGCSKRPGCEALTITFRVTYDGAAV
jgi:hypothetical protein